MRLADLADKRVVVWGTGVEGEQAVMAALDTGAAKVIAAIDGPAPQDAPRTITDQNVAIEYGEDGAQTLREAEVIIKSPGIPPHSRLYKELIEKGKTITTSTELWMADTAHRVIGITGSKGKSTTSSLLAHLMKGLGFDVELGGNIGIPLLSLPKGHDWYVAELSSYQTMTLQQSPRIVVLTSLFPEHLDYHGTIDNYYGAKLNLAAHGPEVVIASSENHELLQRLPQVVPDELIMWVPSSRITVTTAGIIMEGDLLLAASDVPLRGRHNLHNVCLCLAVLEKLGVELAARKADIVQALATYQPLKHRLQIVGTVRDVLWVNDSISTTPQSAIAALEAFPGVPTSIILGGSDRGVSYEPLKKYLDTRPDVITVITMPESGQHIAEALGDSRHPIIHCSSLAEAVMQAAEQTPKGGVVLLSPAAPSYGLFRNFEDRGEQFMAAVSQLK